MDELTKAFPNVWCPNCNKVQPMEFATMKANDRNDHDAADILCGVCGRHPARGACNAICLGGGRSEEPNGRLRVVLRGPTGPFVRSIFQAARSAAGRLFVSIQRVG